MSQPPGWSAPGQPGQQGQAGPSGPGWGAAPPPLDQGTPWGGPPPAPRPGVVPLRPLGVGEILDASIGYIRRNPRATLGLAGIYAVLTGLVQVFVLTFLFTQVPSFTDSAVDPAAGSSDSVDVTVNGISLLQTLIGVFLQLVATGLLAFVMSQAVLGRSVTIGEAWTRVRPLIGRLLGIAALVALVVVGILLVCLLPGALLLVADVVGLGVFLLVIGGIAAAVLLVWAFVGLSLSPVALVLERLTAAASLRRSWELVKGSFWRILGITLLAVILSNIISGIISVPFGLIGGFGTFAFGASGDTALLVGLLGITLGATVGSIITLPFVAGVTSLLYIDRRMRREGLDLELARAAAVPVAPGVPPHASTTPTDASTTPPDEPGTGAQAW